MFSARDPSDIDRFFRGLTEYAFHARLGVVDPPLVDYVALLLVRFLRLDPEAGPAVSLREPGEVVRLIQRARRHDATAAREEFRHIGDATLFWSGLYPEALQDEGRRDRLIVYREAGRAAYRLASELEPADAEAERLLLEQLARDYDLCIEGLGEVRRAWGEAA